MRKLLLLAVILLLPGPRLPAVAVDGSQPLPPPVDVPAGPPQVSGPGGAGMPELRGQPAREPAIAMAGDLCFSDETLERVIDPTLYLRVEPADRIEPER